MSGFSQYLDIYLQLPKSMLIICSCSQVFGIDENEMVKECFSMSTYIISIEVEDTFYILSIITTQQKLKASALKLELLSKQNGCVDV
jgi:hypothetical protein